MRRVAAWRWTSVYTGEENATSSVRKYAKVFLAPIDAKWPS